MKEWKAGEPARVAAAKAEAEKVRAREQTIKRIMDQYGPKPRRLEIGMKVRLTCDLTKYHHGLVVGAIGTVRDTWALRSPWTHDERFAHVIFNACGGWDILKSGLEIVD